MHSKSFRIISVAALLLWMFLIFLLSSETAAESSATSGGFSRWLFSSFYPDFKELSDYRQSQIIEQFSFLIRKAAHIALYTVLGALSSLAVISNAYTSLLLEAALSWSICILYAATDEFHQLYVSGRSGEVRDVIIDSCGAFMGVLFIFAIHGLYLKRKEGKGMRKKELVQKCYELNEEMQEILMENSRLTAELERLRKDNAELRLNTVNDAEQKEEFLPSVIDDEPSRPLPELSEDTEYAAAVIGKMIVSAAEYSNLLSASGNEKNRELINMILGRTEVEKSNILDIILSDASLDDKKKMIDACKNASEEYFESVMAQII